MDKIQRKNVNLRNTLLALYNLPQEARIRTVYQAMGIDIDREEISTHSRAKAAGAAAETLNPQGLHRPVSLRFHRRHMALLYHSQVRPVFSKLLKKSSFADLRAF